VSSNSNSSNSSSLALHAGLAEVCSKPNNVQHIAKPQLNWY
jgi:hypothetical protein